MFFTRVGTVVAWLALIEGVSRAGIGLYVAFGLRLSDVDATKYLGSATSGQAIDRGIMTVLFAIALGILIEISRSVRARAE